MHAIPFVIGCCYIFISHGDNAELCVTTEKLVSGIEYFTRVLVVRKELDFEY